MSAPVQPFGPWGAALLCALAALAAPGGPAAAQDTAPSVAGAPDPPAPNAAAGAAATDAGASAAANSADAAATSPVAVAGGADAGSGGADAGSAAADAGVQRPAATPIRFSAALDKAAVTLGEPFTLTITVIHPPGDTYALPGPLTLLPLAPRGEPGAVRDRVPEGARTVFTLPLVDLGSLSPRIPDLTLLVEGAEGPRSLLIPGQPLELVSLVKLEGEPNPEHAHHGPKPPVPVYIRSWLWAGLLGGLAIAAVALIIWLKLRRRTAAAVEAPPPPSAEDEAFARLADLRRRAPWNSGGARATIFELSEIVRGYLGRRLQFNAIDLTSDELLAALRERPLAGLELEAFKSKLGWEDLVKFAKMEPAADECARAVDEAGVFIERTRPLMAKERHADLAAAGPATGPAQPPTPPAPGGGWG